MDDKEKLEEAKVEEAKVEEATELDLDQLDQVSGGSLKHVKKDKTTDITDSVADRM